VVNTVVEAPDATFAAGQLLHVLAEPGVRASAVRNVPNTLPLFDTHFPRFPILPGVLLLESAFQVALLAAPAAPAGWRLGGVTRARWRRPVRPGDQVLVEVEVVGHDDDGLHLRALLSADGHTVADVRRLTLVARENAAESVRSSLEEQ
jgi:3-hydroxyacyl-[acyl-carrier-protein] dehydratase